MEEELQKRGHVIHIVDNADKADAHAADDHHRNGLRDGSQHEKRKQNRRGHKAEQDGKSSEIRYGLFMKLAGAVRPVVAAADSGELPRKGRHGKRDKKGRYDCKKTE